MTATGEVSGLEQLLVLDRLTVGPVRVERRRLSVPYVVQRADGEAATELAYAWEEDVFEPGDQASENLAAMIGAQVALNYGLFSREIAFRGPFDQRDRRFLMDMARNTAREIYVNKLLRPNPFLVGDAVGLTAVTAPHYLQAELLFDEPPPRPAGRWDVDPGRHAVLSSGGKDSLLSYGLLRELGVEVHPLFVNESGRHWFTALNGFRALRSADPLTARVWTNSDRVFSWMLRQLPFVRRDFANVRADIYPVRLWTVAVFLFGVLPLMRKRRIGRLVIGDENDTSQRVRHLGITHYAGLYDQSVWFDAAMTRWFARKGWGVEQFSLLRPISELLIEKILVERYPDLLPSQMSCHAAHPEGTRMHPCGRCEKCRRIVSMLVALGADPAVCGYRADQIRSCLDSVQARGIHQEREDVAVLLALLRQRGALPAGPGDAMPELPLPLLVKLDAERAPEGAVPDDLRTRVLDIFGQHALGTVRKNGSGWALLDSDRGDPP